MIIVRVADILNGSCKVRIPEQLADGNSNVVDIVMMLKARWVTWGIRSAKVISSSGIVDSWIRVSMDRRGILIALKSPVAANNLGSLEVDLTIDQPIDGRIYLELCSPETTPHVRYQDWISSVDSITRDELVSRPDSSVAGSRSSLLSAPDIIIGIRSAADSVISDVIAASDHQSIGRRQAILRQLRDTGSLLADSYHFVLLLDQFRLSNFVDLVYTDSALPVMDTQISFTMALNERFLLREAGKCEKLRVGRGDLEVLSKLFKKCAEGAFGEGWNPALVSITLDAFAGGFLRFDKEHHTEGCPDSYAFFFIHEVAIGCICEDVYSDFWTLMLPDLLRAASSYIGVFRLPPSGQLSRMGANLDQPSKGLFDMGRLSSALMYPPPVPMGDRHEIVRNFSSKLTDLVRFEPDQ